VFKRENGFTLVELVVVMVILAILGAIIAPRMFDLTTSARLAAMKALQAGVSSAAQLAHAVQVTSGFAAGTSVTVEGQTISMASGYPTANFAGIGTAVQYDTTTFLTSGTGPFIWQMRSATTPTSCQVQYNIIGGAVVITPTTTNCS
jgi:MSHA pilin protein MshA